MKTVLICEKNGVIRQDLLEIVTGYDSKLNVLAYRDIHQAVPVIASSDNLVALIGSGKFDDEDTMRVLDMVRARGGRIVWVGGYANTPVLPPDWIVIDSPFTTQSVEAALKVIVGSDARSA